MVDSQRRKIDSDRRRSGGIGRRDGFKIHQSTAGESSQSIANTEDNESSDTAGPAHWPPHWPDSVRDDAQLCALLTKWPDLSAEVRSALLRVAGIE